MNQHSLALSRPSFPRYEQARTMVMVQNVRRQTDIETIQTVLFLVLRDQGRGKESQAWLLMGTCPRFLFTAPGRRRPH